MYENHLLLRALRDPRSTTSFTIAQWDLCLRLARRAKVLGRIGSLLAEQGCIEELPVKVCRHLDAAQAAAAQQERIVRWELNRLERVRSHLDTPVVLLKGSAYAMASLPPARGRLYSDVDILVPKERLKVVESTLP